MPLLLAAHAGRHAIAIIKKFRRNEDARTRALFVLLATAAFFPIAITVMERPAMYNGIRHFVFVVPPMAMLGGVAGAMLWQRIAAARRLM